MIYPKNFYSSASSPFAPSVASFSSEKGKKEPAASSVVNFPPPSRASSLFVRKPPAFKRRYGLSIFLALGFCAMVLSAYCRFSLQETHKTISCALKEHQKKLHQQKVDLIFLEKNKTALPLKQYLPSKQYTKDQYTKDQGELTRFQIGERLKQLSRKANFQGMGFTIMPEKKVSLKAGPPVNMTKISVSYKTRFDGDLVIWIQSLCKNFPGFLSPRQLTIERMGLDLEDGASFIDGVEGVYIFDWVTMDPCLTP